MAARRSWAGPPRPGPVAGLALAVALAAAVGLLPRWPGLLHLVGLPPVDQLADLRALLVHATSIPMLVAGVLATVAGRIVLLALVLGGLDRERVGLATRWYLTVLPFSTLGAALTFAASASLFYLLFWAGVAVTVVVIAATAAAPWLGGFGASARAWFRVGTVGAYLAGLAVLGALADLGGEWVTVAMVPISAGLTAVTARALVTDPGWRWARRAVAAVPAAGVGALLGVVVAGPAGPPEGGEPADRVQLLHLMSGVDSSSGSGAMLEIDPLVMGWPCEDTRYVSYAGPGAGQPRGDARCPITTGAPYEPEDTLRATDELIDGLEAQLGAEDRPAVLLTHSQGVWVSWLAAAEERLPTLDTLVLVGAFPDNPVPYQVDGAGPGRAGGPILGLVTGVGRPGGTSVFEPGSPLGLEWLAHPTAIPDTLALPLPGDLRVLSVTSVFDHPLMPRGWRIAGATDACPVPVSHPNLPYSGELQARVVAFVDGDEQPPCPTWRRSVGPLFRAFAAPPWRR